MYGCCIAANLNSLFPVAHRDPEHPGKFLRDHHKAGNREQHQAFLDIVEGTPRQKEITDWFRTLPLWLELPGLRVVHACWHQESMELLRPILGPDQTLTEGAVLLGSRKGHPAYEAIEVVCRGPEVGLPPGISFEDKGGKVRHEVRVRWWQGDLATYRKAAIRPPGGYGHDSGYTVAGGVEGASVCRSSGVVRALLVYRKTGSVFAAVCMLGLQCRAGRAAGRVSVGWGGVVEFGKNGVGVGYGASPRRPGAKCK